MLLTPLLSFLAPHDCLGCSAEGSLLCNYCRSGLEPASVRCYRCLTAGRLPRTCDDCLLQTPIGTAYAAVHYSGLAKDIVWRLKFGRAKAAATEMGQILALRLSTQRISSDTVVTHVPTATSRYRQRGYDQAALLAKAFAVTYGLEYASLLTRTGQHKQVGSNKDIRKHQLQHDFHALRPKNIYGRRILLIDDVLTTGATIEACGNVLAAGGARSVDAAVFAQA